MFIEVTTYGGESYCINIAHIQFIKYEAGVTSIGVGDDIIHVEQDYRNLIAQLSLLQKYEKN